MALKRPVHTLGDAFRQAHSMLAAHDIEQAALDARILVCHAFATTHEELIARPERLADQAAAGVLRAALTRRIAREPVSRIIGRRDFWRSSFVLNRATLDPRPDSEILVHAVVECAGSIEHARAQATPLRVLDLGTGSGCLLVSILMELHDAVGVGVDIAPEAIEAARANARTAGVEARSMFVCCHWGEALSAGFDVIVCNPPYIKTLELDDLPDEVRLHDPAAALDGGRDGLDQYRAVMAQIRRLLSPGGWLVLEVGDGQLNEVATLVEDAGYGQDAPLEAELRDLTGQTRCIRATGNGVLTIKS